jgi:hypothetical protein
VFRCRLEDDESGRALELSQWMLDRAACTRTRLAAEALVGLDELRHLKSVLDSARGDGADGAVDNSPIWRVPADIASPPGNPRGPAIGPHPPEIGRPRLRPLPACPSTPGARSCPRGPSGPRR